MGDKPVLRGIHLTRSFGDGEGRTTPLRDVSLDLHRGQLALLMGPSGSGKSTLLAILSGLLEPDAGEVHAEDGEVMQSIWKLGQRDRERFRLRNVGFVFQGYNLFPALSARRQLELILEWGEGMSHREARNRSEEMLAKLGLEKQTRKLPSQLSGGEKQRVAIGRALIKNPRYCFADEPTSALDWHNGQHVIELLRDAAHKLGSTVLVVSHDTRILPFVDVSFSLEDGQIKHEATARSTAGPSPSPWRIVS